MSVGGTGQPADKRIEALRLFIDEPFVRGELSCAAARAALAALAAELAELRQALTIREEHLDALNLAAGYYRHHLKEIRAHTFDDNEGLSQIKIRVHAEEAVRAADGALAGSVAE